MKHRDSSPSRISLVGGAARSARVRRRMHARRGEQGLTILLVAILALVLIGFTGLAVDLSRVYTASQQLQAAADAAALAAANRVSNEIDPMDPSNPFTATRQMAIAVALKNMAAAAPVKLSANTPNAANGDIVIGRWDKVAQTFTPELKNPNAVKVTARRTTSSQGGPVSLVFGPVFAVNGADVGRTAIAVMSKTLDPLILVLDPDGSPGLKMGGNGNLDIMTGSVQVNSDENCAVEATGSATVTTPLISTCGTACAPVGAMHGPLEEKADPIADPLADVLPDTASWNAFKASLAKPLGASGKITATGTYSPGYYPKGLDINNTTVATLSPGTYMFGDKFDMQGGASLLGDGVTILIDKGAIMELNGNGVVTLSPPSSGMFEGVTIFSHRENSSDDAVTLGGTGVLTIDGMVYVPGGTLAMIGTSIKAIGGIICWQADIWGNGVVTGNKLPPPEALGTVYLVQ